MVQVNDYRIDRENLPDVLYVEDSNDWVSTWRFPNVVRNGLGKSVSRYKKVDDAFLCLVTEDNLPDFQRGIDRKANNQAGFSVEDLDLLSRSIEPNRLKGRIFIFDNETPGWLRGINLIDVIINASQGLSDAEKPRIISLMCSDPEVVKSDGVRLSRWESYGVESLHKDHYPFFIFWAGQYLKGEKKRFSEWFKEITGVSYEDRESSHDRIQPIRENFGVVVDFLGENNHGDILTRIGSKEITEVANAKELNFKEVGKLMERWDKSFGETTRKPSTREKV